MVVLLRIKGWISSEYVRLHRVLIVSSDAMDWELYQADGLRISSSTRVMITTIEMVWIWVPFHSDIRLVSGEWVILFR